MSSSVGISLREMQSRLERSCWSFVDLFSILEFVMLVSMKRITLVAAVLILWHTSACDVCRGQAMDTADIVVYGGTSSGIIAAIQARRMGKTVVLLEPSNHVGGLTTGGLGATDIGNKSAIGGLARDFYHRVWKHYQVDAAWNRE